MRWFRRRTRDFDDEIAAHLAIETDRLVAEGWSREDAALAARRTFGNVTTARERFYEGRRLASLDRVLQDLRAGARNLRRYPATAAVAILSIAAGIAAMTCFLTLRNVVFENPPPLYADPEQLSKIQVGPVDRLMLPIGRDVPANLLDSWRNTADVSFAAATPPRAARDIRTGEGVVTGRVRGVTANFFSVLGVAPAIGRTFTAGPAGDGEAVLSHRLWQLWFAGREEALGSTIWIDDRAYTVVGVMPVQFWFATFDPSVWTRLDAATVPPDDMLQVVGRRPEGMTHASLEARLEASVRGYSRARGGTPLQLRASAVKGTPYGDQMSLILPFVFGASVLLTLLIACANVAILIIAQWTTRERETAVRAALGASRWRVVRALLAESIVLATIAGTLGVGATFALRAILVGRSNPEFMNLAIDPAIFWQAALITILTGVAAGLGPALFETRRLQLDPLRGLATSDRVRQRWSHALVVVEITVTLALLVVTTSMIDAYQRGRDADFGFDPDAYAVATVNGLSTSPGDVVAELRTIAGVQAAAAATGAPFAGRGPVQAVATDAAGSNGVRAERLEVSAGFFETLALGVRAGRTFTTADEGAGGVAVVNQAAAVQLFGSAAVGRQLWVNGSPHDVIGVVADYASTPIEQRLPMPKVFLPLGAESRAKTMLRFVVRGADPAALVRPVRRTVEDASPNPVLGAYTFRQILDVQGQEMLLGTAPFLPLIVIGLLLTSSGVYGVLAFAIARRSRELAVRVAIGAGPRDQVWLVIARSARLVGAGLACGVVVTFGLSRIVRAAGGAGSLYDPPWHAFVIPVAIVIVVGAVATWLPTRRVLRINPARLLANCRVQSYETPNFQLPILNPNVRRCWEVVPSRDGIREWEFGVGRRAMTMTGQERIENAGGIVLAGGRSTRMGTSKALLPFGDETMLQRVVRVLGGVVSPIVIVAAAGQELPPLPDTVILSRDEREGRGPLEGLRAGLKALPEEVDAAYVTSCDVPLLVPGFVRQMLELSRGYDVAVMEIEGFTHPLSAIYRRATLPHVEALLAQDRLRPVFLFDAVRTRRIRPEEITSDPDLRTLRNLNTREDYERALAEVDASRGSR